MYCDDPLPDSSYDTTIEYGWFTALGELVWDISRLPYDDIDSLRRSELLIFGWFLFVELSLVIDLAFSELCLYDLIMDDSEYRSWLAREIAELYEDIFTFLGIEGMSIDIFEYREFFVEAMSIVLHQIRVEYGTTFFDKKCPLLTIDKLSDIFSSLGSRNKREPNWFGLAIFVCDDLDTLSIAELVVEWYNMPVYFCYRDRVPEIGVDRIRKIYRSRSLR